MKVKQLIEELQKMGGEDLEVSIYADHGQNVEDVSCVQEDYLCEGELVHSDDVAEYEPSALEQRVVIFGW